MAESLHHRFRVTVRKAGEERQNINCELELGPSPSVTQIINGLTATVHAHTGMPDTQYAFCRITATHLSNTAGQPEDVFAVCIAEGNEQQFSNAVGELFSKKDVSDIKHKVITPGDVIFTAPQGHRSKVVAWKQNSTENIDIQNALMMQTLGGNENDVCLYQEQGGNGRQFVWKKLRLESVRDVELAETENVILRNLIHPNIVRYYAYVITQNRLDIYMEYVAGTSLLNEMEEGIMDHERVRNYTSQIVDALAYLHDEGLIHRDIKPSNFLISAQGILKLKGFRLLRSIKSKPSGAQTQNSNFLTKYKDSSKKNIGGRKYVYKSPEVMKDGSYSMEADIWSVGLVVLQMLSGEEPWRDKRTLCDIHDAILKQEPPHGTHTSIIPGLWMNFFNLVFNYNGAERPTAEFLKQQFVLNMYM